MKYALKNALVLDGSLNMKPQKKTVVVDGDKIVAVAENVDTTGCKVIDLDGKYLMPGLINLHVHLPASGKPNGSKGNPVKLVKFLTSFALGRWLVRIVCQKNAETHLKSGTTTIRTVGGILGVDSKVRDRINCGKNIGPRVVSSNMAISVPEGHMAGSLAYSANSVDDVEYYFNEIIKTNPDWIKLMITGGVLDAKVKGEPGELKMPAEFVKKATDLAHAKGLKVAAHVESTEGVKLALENGVDSIEHGAKADDEIIALFKEKGACLVTTLSPAFPYSVFPREASGITETEYFNGQIVFNGIVDCAKKCLANGIDVGLGTDTGCPYVLHYDTWRELKHFAKHCNVTNAFALHTATVINAKILGIDGETGSVEVGKSADLVVTDCNPLDDLGALSNIYAVMAKGKLLIQPKVKKNAKAEAEFGKYFE